MGDGPGKKKRGGGINLLLKLKNVKLLQRLFLEEEPNLLLKQLELVSYAIACGIEQGLHLVTSFVEDGELCCARRRSSSNSKNADSGT